MVKRNKEINVKVKEIPKISWDKGKAEKILTVLLIIANLITIGSTFYVISQYVKPKVTFNETINNSVYEAISIGSCVQVCVTKFPTNITNCTSTCK